MTTNNNIPPQTLAQKLAMCADILRNCVTEGLHFATNPYELNRWRRTQDVTLELLALASARPLEELEPLRAKIFVQPSPFSAGDGAVMDNEGRMVGTNSSR